MDGADRDHLPPGKIVNTENDAIDNEKLMTLLNAVQPSWKQQTIRPNPSTSIYERPVPPRRAIFKFDEFGGTQLSGAGNGGDGGGGGGGPGNPPVPMTEYQCSGNLNGTASLIYLFGPTGQ